MISEKMKLPVLQNRVFDTRDQAINAKYGYVQFEQNPISGIMENILFDSSIVAYDKNYDNEQSLSPIFEKHLDEVIRILTPFLKEKRIVEIGCGKGFFFNKLSEKGFDIEGCDPTYEGTDNRIVKRFFSKELGLSGDIIIIRGVLEHVQNPIEFLKSIAETNNNRGIVFIEGRNLEWIIKNQVYFDIYYEQVSIFMPDDFKRIFGRIYDSGFLFSDQYQYVIADLSLINNPPYTFEKFEKKPIFTLKRLYDTVKNLESYKGKPTFIWGASSKGVISSIYLLNEGINIDGLIDINPKKQNKYAPLSGLKIISPESFIDQFLHSSANILIANENYASEIKESLKGMNITYINL